MDTARAQWELENDVEAASESDEASLFRYDEAQQKKIQEEKPWKQNPNYFKHVRVSALALIKMTMHCRSGGELEVMGMLQAVRERVIAAARMMSFFRPLPPHPRRVFRTNDPPRREISLSRARPSDHPRPIRPPDPAQSARALRVDRPRPPLSRRGPDARPSSVPLRANLKEPSGRRLLLVFLTTRRPLLAPNPALYPSLAG